MSRSVIVRALLVGFVLAAASCSPRTAPHSEPLPAKARADVAALGAQSPYQHQDTWYEFMLKQFNPDNIDYGRWVERERCKLFELLLNNPYFLYSSSITIALLLAATACAKQWVDHRRAMWVTAEMMADLYNQDAYSREIAQEAIERFNEHIERCNRAIEQVETNAGAAAGNNEAEQLRTELMRVAEERDRAIRDRDVAREELRRKSEILADMSVRLESAGSKGGPHSASQTAADPRPADVKLVNHINNLQEQLYAERKGNRRLRGA